MAEGKISFVKNADGHKLIDVAELMRVYGNNLDFSRVGTEPTSSPSKSGGSLPTTNQIDHAQLSGLQREIDIINKDRQREREQYQEEISHLRKSLDKALDGQNRVTLLLENHSKGGGEWEKSIRGLENRLANQEKMQKEFEDYKNKSRAERIRLKEALEKEKNKTLWQKLFASN